MQPAGSPIIVRKSAELFEVGGPLNVDSAAELQREGQKAFADAAAQFNVDLSGVSVADSAGLALLIDWLAWAADHGRQVSYLNVSDALLALARISEVQELLLPQGRPA